ncbi:ribonuclease HI family protein [Peribacillus sp. B-H-3]|uniref:ribonuclease HI family protein n=1 Tax=Peribacillus sp. B-H-3 TaxID=3400420 RepID=UPI003B011B5A
MGVHAFYEDTPETNIFEISESAGIGTNNEAEYFALLKGMNTLIKLGLTENVEIMGDSQVVIKQMTKEYKCKDFHLQRLYVDAHKLATKFTNLKFIHVKREYNELADELSKRNVKRTLVDYYNYKF